MLFAGWGVRMVKNCDLGLENAALSLWPRAAFSRPRAQFFTIQTPQPANNIYIYMYLHYIYFLHNAYITLTCTTYNTYITIQVHLSNRITVDLFMLLFACCSSY